MKKLLLLFVCILAAIAFAAPAEAAPVTQMAWDAPTTYADGTTLHPNAIDHYTVYCGQIVSGVGNVVSVQLAAVLSSAADGLHTCSVTVTTIWGVESDPSNSVTLYKAGTNFFGSNPVAPAGPGGLRLL